MDRIEILTFLWFRDGPEEVYAVIKAYSDGKLIGHFTDDICRKSFELGIDTEEFNKVRSAVVRSPKDRGVRPYIGVNRRIYEGESHSSEDYCITREDLDGGVGLSVEAWVKEVSTRGGEVASH